jgi:hypothetical protein
MYLQFLIFPTANSYDIGNVVCLPFFSAIRFFSASFKALTTIQKFFPIHPDTNFYNRLYYGISDSILEVA